MSSVAPFLRRSACVPGATLLFTLACTPFLDATGEVTYKDGPGKRPPKRGLCRARLAQEVGSPGPTDEGTSAPYVPDPTLRAYLKLDPPQPLTQLGYRIAATADAVATSAPFESLSREGMDAGQADAGQNWTCEGATYLFEREHDFKNPLRFVIPYASEDDGIISSTEGPKDLLPYPLGWGTHAVALDDDVLVVGVAGEDSSSARDPADESAPESGAVYVWDRHAPDNPPQYIKAPSIHTKAIFGWSVALSGTRLVVGSPGDPSAKRIPEDDSTPSSGAAYIYERRNGKYEFAHYIKSPYIRAGDVFGSGVAIAGDLVAIGAAGEDSTAIGIHRSNFATVIENSTKVDGTAIGAAYVYRYTGAEWRMESYLKPSTTFSGTYFGLSIAVSGNHVAVGAPGVGYCPDSVSGSSFRGAVYVFTDRDGGSAEGKCLSPHGDHGDAFGFSLALLGNRLAVGAFLDDSLLPGSTEESNPASGAAYLFDWSADAGWKRLRYIKPPNSVIGDVFGVSVALADGVLAVGAPQEPSSNSSVAMTVHNDAHFSGAAYVYDLPE